MAFKYDMSQVMREANETLRENKAILDGFVLAVQQLAAHMGWTYDRAEINISMARGPQPRKLTRRVALRCAWAEARRRRDIVEHNERVANNPLYRPKRG